MHIARGRLVGQDHARGLIHPQMQFAPQAASGDPMLANFPLTLAEHLQSRAVHHQMSRARSTGVNRNVQPRTWHVAQSMIATKYRNPR